MPVPSHHGQGSVDGEPPWLEMTVPVPRHTVQGCGSAASGVSSPVLNAPRGYRVPNRSGREPSKWTFRAGRSPSSVAPMPLALRLLAAAQLLQGLLLAVVPGTFYDALAHFGPRNDHFLRDYATYFLASAVVLWLAASRPSWRAPVLALVGLQLALHTLNHLLDVGGAHPGWVGPFDLVTLAAATVLVAALYRDATRTEVVR